MSAAVYAAMGALFIDVFGYVYHRWVEHGHLLARFPRNRTLRRIAERHAIHHTKLYPPENLRPERGGYETQDLLSWYLPAALVTLAVFAFLPWRFAIPFAIGGWSYGISIDLLHRLFHNPRHALDRNPLFLALQKIHDIHHIDQRRNFTIVVPVLDLLGRSFARTI